MIHFKANGKEHKIDEPINITSFLKKKNLNLGSVIVEVNKEFLQKSLFEKTYINDGDNIEIVRAFGGG